jgi:hypothetical protein
MNPSYSSPAPFFALSLLGFFTLPMMAVAVDFREEVRPILNKKCFKCHTGPKAKGSLRMDSDEDFSKRIGGDDPVIVPGDAAKSLLAIKAGLPRTDSHAMPPPPARERGAEAMTSLELNLVKQWISLGAKLKADEAGTTEAAPAAPATGAAMTAEMQTWTNSAGASLEASFVALEGDHVTLRKTDGSTFEYLLVNLNAESQALAKKLAEQ